MNGGYQYPYYYENENCDAFIAPQTSFPSFSFTPFSTPSATPSEMIDSLDPFSPSSPDIYRYNNIDFTLNELINYYTKYLLETNDYLPPDLYLQIERGLCPTWPHCDLESSNCWYFHPDQAIQALDYFNAENDKKPDERISRIGNNVFVLERPSPKPLSFPIFSPPKPASKTNKFVIDEPQIITEPISPPQIDDRELLKSRLKKKKTAKKQPTSRSSTPRPSPIDYSTFYSNLEAQINPRSLNCQLHKRSSRERISRHFSTQRRDRSSSCSLASPEPEFDLFLERPKNYQNRRHLHLLTDQDNTMTSSYYQDMMVPVSAQTYQDLYLEASDFDDDIEALNANAELFVPSMVLSGIFDEYSAPVFKKSPFLVRAIRKIDSAADSISNSLIFRIFYAIFELLTLVFSYFYSALSTFFTFLCLQIFSALQIAFKYPMTMFFPFIGAYFFPFLCYYGVDENNLSYHVEHLVHPSKTARHIALPFAQLFGFILDKKEQEALFERTNSPLIIYTAIGPRATIVILTLISSFLFWRLPPFIAPVLDQRHHSWPSFLTPHLKSANKSSSPRISTTMILFLTVPPTVRITLIYWLAEHIKSQRLEPTSTFNSTVVPLIHSLLVLFVALLAPRAILNVLFVYTLSVNILAEKLNIVPSKKIFHRKQ